MRPLFELELTSEQLHAALRVSATGGAPAAHREEARAIAGPRLERAEQERCAMSRRGAAADALIVW